jgi:hypothetical protein
LWWAGMAAASWRKAGGRKAASIAAMSDTMLDAGMPLITAAAYIVDEGALSFVTVIYFPIWILHTSENVRGRMTKVPRLNRPRSCP